MKNVWDGNELRCQLHRPLELLHTIIRNIKYSWQRITKGYCDIDVMDIDLWFMKIMPDMLQQFKDKGIGYPSILGAEYKNEDEIGRDDICRKEWNKILEEIIFLFQEMDEETCQNKNPNKKELALYRENCKNQAFALFSKWFHHLWY